MRVPEKGRSIKPETSKFRGDDGTTMGRQKRLFGNSRNNVRGVGERLLRRQDIGKKTIVRNEKEKVKKTG